MRERSEHQPHRRGVYMSTIGWLFIFAAIFLVRAVFKGQILDASGRFILPDILQQYMVAFITNDGAKFKQLEAMTSTTGLLEEGEKPPTPDESGITVDGGGSFPRAQMGSGARPKAPIPGGKPTSNYFGKPNPMYTAGRHTGVDWAVPGKDARGLPVLAVVSGVVLSQQGGAAYGKHIMIKGVDGHTWLYAHLQDKTVSTGQTVIAGNTIGHVGSTGQVTSNFAHLHLEKSAGPVWHYNDVINPTW